METIFLQFLIILADEEIGAEKGMQTFMKTVEFEQLNVGLVLDEGLASPDDTYTVFCGERNCWCKYFLEHCLKVRWTVFTADCNEQVFSPKP